MSKLGKGDVITEAEVGVMHSEDGRSDHKSGVQAAFRSWKRQGNGLSQKRQSPAQTLILACKTQHELVACRENI